MIRIFKTEDGIMHEKDELQPGSWIAMTNPTASEIIDIADMYQIDPDHIKAPDPGGQSVHRGAERKGLVCDDPHGHHHHQRSSDYGLSGGDAGADVLYGRTGPGFPHIHEDQVHFTDSV